MKPSFGSVEGVLSLVGKQLADSEWVVISQERINQFAEATGDHQWIHVDPVKAKDGPFGACIAHGYLSLSLVASFQEQMATLDNLKMGVNYGTDKVRFPSAVKVGSRLRGKGELIAAEKTKDGGVQAIIRVTVEIEGAERPACVAETISRYYFN
ncbi:MaoC family dehydratase [Stenotrophobium rhamnosiphilum]|uniref:Dehydratase n=1 Tax=Stenotrophobium rhamnosiphilum TaxID=2029166 RepID=A0A2T5MG87_9GAMM|nr:MaoC family dehydratase [Stenotrophobium rhamnosiphilum]PTU31591.1 dehydratase [Stenotrophobium rhamnosiphilum]